MEIDRLENQQVEPVEDGVPAGSLLLGVDERSVGSDDLLDLKPLVEERWNSYTLLYDRVRVFENFPRFREKPDLTIVHGIITNKLSTVY